MGSAAVKIKIMPDAPDADLIAIEENAVKIIEEDNGKIVKVEHEPIAFGLNAIIITFAWHEDAEREILEEKLSKVPHVNSAEVIDFRRAFG
ncbi:MAG TPA: elongation factor 1-beta [Candidatus Nanoarchaeia archaeon]|nr:elongation factor 1-beta [Candidatus Nanoarchaeia archaeon]